MIERNIPHNPIAPLHRREIPGDPAEMHNTSYSIYSTSDSTGTSYTQDLLFTTGSTRSTCCAAHQLITEQQSRDSSSRAAQEQQRNTAKIQYKKTAAAAKQQQVLKNGKWKMEKESPHFVVGEYVSAASKASEKRQPQRKNVLSHNHKRLSFDTTSDPHITHRQHRDIITIALHTHILLLTAVVAV